MPLQAYSQSIQRSTPAFENKLNQVTSFFQTLQQNETAKVQMAEQMEMRRDFAEFQQGLQLEGQKEMFELQRNAEQEQAQAEAINKSFTEAIDVQKELADLINKDYSEVVNFNLADYNVNVQFDERSGRYTHNIILDGEPVDYQTFRDEITQRASFAKQLDEIRFNKEEYAPGARRGGAITLGSDNIEGVIRDVITSPEDRELLYSMWRQGNLQPAKKAEDDPDEDSPNLPRSDSYSQASQMKYELGETGVFEANFTTTNWRGRPSGGTKVTVDFRDSVPRVRKNIENAIKETYDFDLNAVRLNSEVWQAIQSNSRRDLNSDERKLATALNRADGTGDDLERLMRYYRTYEMAFREWSRLSGSEAVGTNLEHLRFNWMDWTGAEGIETMFTDTRNPDLRAVEKVQADAQQFLP